MTRRAATLAGLGAILLWSLLAVLTAATGTVPPFELTALTFAIGGLTGAVRLLRRPGALSVLRQSAAVWALGIGGLFGYHALYFAALRLAPPAEAGLVCYLWPLLIVLLSALLPGERLRVVHLVGAALGFTGLLVLVASRGPLQVRAGDGLGFACAAAAALVWASYSVLSRRVSAVPTDVVAGFCLATAALSVPAHLLLERTVWPDSAVAWVAIAALGLGPVGAAFYLWDVAMKRGDIRFLGIAAYAAPVLSTLILVAAGYAQASPSLGLACLLIVGGALVPAVLRPRVTAA